MDFELAAWQLTYLCLAPKRVYRNVYFHKQTKNTWARDDPAILVLISACLCVSSLAWSLIYSLSPVSALKLALLMVLRDFVCTGLVVATILWQISRLFLAPSPSAGPLSSGSAFQTPLEFAYAFDVHTNAFFPFFLTLYLFQLFLLPVVRREEWVCLWVGNTLWLAGFAQYIYGIYLGLNALPHLTHTSLLLTPLLPLFTAYIISLLGFNVAKWALSFYFGVS